MNRTPIAFALISLVFAAGCATPQDAASTDPPARLVLAFSVKDDFDSFVTQTQPLADWMSARTGIPTTVLPVADESASIVAVATGQAHAAFMDAGAGWIGWTTFGLQAIAADVNSDGRTGYTAIAWVKADSDIETVEDLRGKRSCHTGELKSAGMLAPMGYLIGNGLVDVSGLDLDDIASLQRARERFFGSSTIGGEYSGAFQCLSTDIGDVAFVKDSTWNDTCEGNGAPAWCLPRDGYRMLPAEGFAYVPSHPVMVAKTLHAGTRANILDALLALNDAEEGRAILNDVLHTSAVRAVTTEEHLGSYGDVLEHVPGIQSYLNKKKFA